MKFTLISKTKLGQVVIMDSVCVALVANNFYMPHEEGNVIPSLFCLIAAVCCVLQGTCLALHILMWHLY